LTETNVPHRENLSYFGDGTDEAQVIYNFTLPPLILHTLHTGNAQKLSKWASGIEKIGDTATYLNFTASHDGIGVRPAEGILTEEERNHLVQLTLKGGGRVSEKRNSDGSTSPYELNITYFDAVNSAVEAGEDILIKRFLLSQSIPLSFMGIPAIYIHSLLGSRNDTANLAKTGMARSINRSRLSWDALSRQLSDSHSLRAKVLEKYLRLLSVRKGESAFHPNAGQKVLETDARVFALKRFNTETGQTVAALHNVSGNALALDYNCLELNCPATDLLDGAAFSPGDRVPLSPWQVRWLKAKS
jgi:sucrose phosphorylase